MFSLNFLSKSPWCSTVLLKVLQPPTLQKELLQVSFLGIYRTTTLQNNFGCLHWYEVTLVKKCNNPMDTPSSIRYRFVVEIPRGKFVETTSILKSESTWKLWHRLDVEISTWIRLSKSTKYGWVFHVDFPMSFRRRIAVTSLLAVSIVSFSNILCSGDLFYAILV